MPLNKSTGNMYEFVTHTWNTIKGKCPHDCSYCYMKRFKQNPVHFDEKELKTDLGSGNFIFVGSSCDMFAENILRDWIIRTLNHCEKFDNKYLFQTKNPYRLIDCEPFFPPNTSICTTIETNRHYPEIMRNAPVQQLRASGISYSDITNRYVTIEPIIDFDLFELVELIKMCEPKQVNIGADTGRNNLPEPEPGKVLELITELSKFTVVHQKSNLKRITKNTK